jgi:hypothetical protein
MMTEPSQSKTELSDEFRKLGENLAESLKALWEHPETRQFRTEMKDGLTQLGDSLNQAVHSFSESPEGQQLQTGIEELGEKIRTGEVEAQARNELINALSRINMELEKVRENLEEKGAREEGVSIDGEG